MAKRTDYSISEDSNDEQFPGAFDELEIDNDDEFFKRYVTPNRKLSKRAEARRLIEQYREDKELRDRLDEYHFHIDD